MNRSIEYSIVEYLLNHSEGIRQQLQVEKIGECESLFQPEFNNAVTSEVVSILCKGLGLSYIEVSEIVTEDYLIEILGRDWFVM